MAIYTPQISERMLRADCTRRPLDWRFRRAVALSARAPRGRYPRTTDDDLICQYADMLHRLRKTDSFESFERIRKRHPELVDIHCVYADMNKTELAILDAFLLSQSMDPELVRKQSGLTEHQQSLYRKMFLDIEDRRDMSVFIASQLMEPAKLRNIAKEYRAVKGPKDPENKPTRRDQEINNGTLSLEGQCSLRVIGYYSSPVVLELIYTGFLQGTVPVGRDSATRFLTQGVLASLRSGSVMGLREIRNTVAGIEDIIKAGVRLAQEEKEEGQIDIIDSVMAYFAASRPRVGKISKIMDKKAIPAPVYDGPYEYREEEIAEIRETGKIPEAIQALLAQAKELS